MKFPLLYLRDTNLELVECWKAQFGKITNVSVSDGDIFDIPADAIISPANGLGIMTGGIDLVYVQKFGPQLQDRVNDLLRPVFEIPVGSAAYLPAFVDRGPYVILAPTMRLFPSNLDNTLNPYYAFRAALLKVRELAETTGIESVICPGMGTGAGRACVDMAARQMLAAYHNVVFGRPPTDEDVRAQHNWMLSCSAADAKLEQELKEKAEKEAAPKEEHAADTNS